jgi:hypothetical protein
MQFFGHQYAGIQLHVGYQEEMEQALPQIWPVVSSGVEWPGKYKLGYDGVDALTHSVARYI